MATHAVQMVTKLETVMLAHAGKEFVSHDGSTVKFSKLREEWTAWKKVVANESGQRARTATVDLS